MTSFEVPLPVAGGLLTPVSIGRRLLAGIGIRRVERKIVVISRRYLYGSTVLFYQAHTR